MKIKIKIENLVGQKFNRWTVLTEGERDKYNKRTVICKCDCGETKSVGLSGLLNGSSKSCGCLLKEKLKNGLRVIHGQTRRVDGGKHRTREYSAWEAMRQRVLNSNNKKFSIYGGKGIKICDRWLESFQNFLEDMGECPEGYTLERKDGEGDYCPENCKWASYDEQNNNTSRNRFVEYNGEKRTVSQWAKQHGIKVATLYARLYIMKWPIYKAFTTKVNNGH